MPHKETPKRHFAKPYEWSYRKHFILSYYITPYLAKVASIKTARLLSSNSTDRSSRRPVVVVDAFAGKGKYDDGSRGSPLILAKAVAISRAKNNDVSMICVERNRRAFFELSENMKDCPFATLANESFADFLPKLSSISKTHSVFIFIDPFAAKGVEWRTVSSVLELITPDHSVEVLLNFNAVAFARWGLSALGINKKGTEDIPEGLIPEVDDDDAETRIEPSIDGLCRNLNGDWWVEVLNSSPDFRTCVSRLTEVFCANLRERFQNVCATDIKDDWGHSCPKYYLIHASSHKDAFVLMNDAVSLSREMWARQQGASGMLIPPEELVPDTSRLPKIVYELAQTRQTRGQLIQSVIKQNFGYFQWKQIRQVIESLLADGHLSSGTGKKRINDDVDIWAVDQLIKPF